MYVSSYIKEIKKLLRLILLEKEQLLTHEHKSECLSILEVKHQLDDIFSFW